MGARAVLATLLVASTAQAADFAVNAGALEVVGLPPQHLGLYLYAGGSLAFVSERGALVPGLALEVAPENGRLGLVATVVADYPVTSGLGVDAQLALIHDQQGLDFRSSVFFAGAGGGVSLFFGKFTVSPFLNLFIALDSTKALSLVPGVNVAYAF
jgi:hypothetical protein